MKSSQRYDRRIVRGVAARVHETGNWSLYVEEDPNLRIPELKDWHWDGIIADFDDRKTAETVSDLKIPIVGIGGGYGWYDDKSGIPYVTTDNCAIGTLGAEHLLGRGFLRFAFCGFPRTRIDGWSDARAQAFRQRIEEAGFPCSVFTAHKRTARQWGKMQSELSKWLVSLEKPIGLMTCNDIRARHVLEACRNLGIRVPDDIAVIGVDNDEVMCELTTPPLTSIEQGSTQIGYQAALLLEKLMTGKKILRSRILLEPEDIVVRQSTDVFAIEDQDVAAALAFIRSNVSEKIHIGTVAYEVGISRRTLEAKFREFLGRSILEEIHRMRVEMAKQLLIRTNLPMPAIAKRTGFANAPRLAIVFGQTTGMSPTDFRRRSKAVR